MANLNPVSTNIPSQALNSQLVSAGQVPTRGISTVRSFEQALSDYINFSPELICVVEYVVGGEFKGVLLVWEKYFKSTHYEVYKKNLFNYNAQFERILFLDAVSLTEETQYYLSYVNDIVGLNVNKEKYYIILDTNIKPDRIYEYKIKAFKVPTASSNISYGHILQSKLLTNSVVVNTNNNNTIYDFAQATMANKDLAWIVALMNDNTSYFGMEPLVKKMVDYNLPVDKFGQKFAYVVNDKKDIMTIFNESVSLFKITGTVQQLLLLLGGIGVNIGFNKNIIASIDTNKNTFSYDRFRTLMLTRYVFFNTYLSLIGSTPLMIPTLSGLKKLDSFVMKNTGSAPFSSIANITNILKFINGYYIVLSYYVNNTAQIEDLLDSGKK